MSSKKKRDKSRPKNKTIVKALKYLRVDKFRDRPKVKNNQFYVEDKQ